MHDSKTVAFKTLYDQIQGSQIHVNRNEIKAKAIKVAGVGDVKFVRSGIDVSVCRGCWLTPTNTEHHLVKQFGCYVAVAARDLNRCWDRFVTVKEMMHLFDEEDQKTKNAQGWRLGAGCCYASIANLRPPHKEP